MIFLREKGDTIWFLGKNMTFYKIIPDVYFYGHKSWDIYICNQKTVHFRVAVCHYGLKTSLRETNEMKKINICMKMQNSFLFTFLCTK